jgi:integrase
MAWIMTNHHGYLRIGFRFRGVECREGTKLKDTPENRRRLQAKADHIQDEIDHGVFEYRRHFPKGTRASLFEPGSEAQMQMSRITFARYARQWLEENAYALTPSTYASYRTAIDQHMVPFFGALPLAEVTDAHLKRFIAHLQRQPGKRGRLMGPKSINNYMSPMKAMLKEAVQKQLLASDPTAFIRRLRVPRPDVDPFSPEEIAQFLTMVTPHYRTYFHLAFLTGMRPHEQIALKWGNVDFVHRTIAVREGRVGKVEGLPKTEQSIRDIDMLEPVYDLLRHHRSETLLCSVYVFLNQGGRPIDLTTLRRRIWYPTLMRGGVRRRALYQTRHTYATLMLATGENPEWIAKQLGHTSTQMLFQRYAKFIPNVTRQDGTAFLRAYRQWFSGRTGVGDVASQDADGRGGGPLGAFYVTFTPPQQQRGQAHRLTP